MIEKKDFEIINLKEKLKKNQIDNKNAKNDFKKCLSKKVTMEFIKKDVLNIHHRYMLIDPKIKKIENLNFKINEEMIFKKRQRDLLDFKERTQNLSKIATDNIYIKKKLF